MLVYRLFAEVVGLALFDRHCTGRADAEAESGTVAQFVSNDLRFAVHQLDGPFGAGADACAAAVAGFFIDFHDLADPFHFLVLLDLHFRGLAGVRTSRVIGLLKTRIPVRESHRLDPRQCGEGSQVVFKMVDWRRGSACAGMF